MLSEWLGLTSLALISLGFAAALIAIVTWPRGPARRCGGANGFLRTEVLLSPATWWVRGRCWYDLTGLPIDASGKIRCPECGLQSKAGHALRDGRRFRWGAVSLVALLCGIVSFGWPWFQSGAWTRPVPLVALVELEHWNAGSIRHDARKEIEWRVANGAVAGWGADVLATKLARDLQADDERWNAHRGMRLLEQLWPHSEAALETTLTSTDVQARLLAARLLRSRSSHPSDELLRACVADLRDDSKEVAWYLSRHNAGEAAEYLVLWADCAAAHLVEAMSSPDMQQRLLAAAIAGHAGRIDLLNVAAPILIEHLRDNDIRGDAKIAAPAMYRFGPAAIPYLQVHENSDDAQLRGVSLAIIERLMHPDRPLHALRDPMPRITVTRSDPLTQLSIRDSMADLR